MTRKKDTPPPSTTLDSFFLQQISDESPDAANTLTQRAIEFDLCSSSTASIKSFTDPLSTRKFPQQNLKEIHWITSESLSTIERDLSICHPALATYLSAIIIHCESSMKTSTITSVPYAAGIFCKSIAHSSSRLCELGIEFLASRVKLLQKCRPVDPEAVSSVLFSILILLCIRADSTIKDLHSFQSKLNEKKFASFLTQNYNCWKELLNIPAQSTQAIATAFNLPTDWHTQADR